jgi:WXG100 family type VII secretion target
MLQAGFNVDTDLMAQKSQQVAQLVTQIQQQLSQLNTQMQEMFATWLGQASTGFQNLHTNWNSQYLQLNQRLETISQNLATNSRGYVGADESSTPKSTTV